MTQPTALPALQTERISIFDMLKIGIGPSSSHTLGPWRAAQQWINQLEAANCLHEVRSLKIYLYGSLAKTGTGHGTDLALLMGLSGEDPETIDPADLLPKIEAIKRQKQLLLGGVQPVGFDVAADIVFLRHESLPFHANALRLAARLESDAGESLQDAIFYSIGGGFVVQHGLPPTETTRAAQLPFPCDDVNDLLRHCQTHQFNIGQMVWHNEQAWRTPDQIRADLLRIWQTMKNCAFRGAHTEGVLPGSLRVTRRAAKLNRKCLPADAPPYRDADGWLAVIKAQPCRFDQILQWISCFAFAVNEENAAFGRVVTAPTNGAAGVIPSVLLYFLCFAKPDATDDDALHFLGVAAEIGSFFKKGATISAAMGGCQAEIGVSSAMAAAALTECSGGTVEQALMAAEIAMEHHLGLTCDPVAGLVQIPCIERNSMGAVKAITAARIALAGEPALAKVSLDAVIRTMWSTAQDMNSKYKETSEGGLALSVGLAEC